METWSLLNSCREFSFFGIAFPVIQYCVLAHSWPISQLVLGWEGIVWIRKHTVWWSNLSWSLISVEVPVPRVWAGGLEGRGSEGWARGGAEHYLDARERASWNKRHNHSQPKALGCCIQYSQESRAWHYLYWCPYVVFPCWIKQHVLNRQLLVLILMMSTKE